MVNGSIGYQKDNLYSKKALRTGRTIGSANISFNPNQKYGLNLVYSNYGFKQNPSGLLNRYTDSMLVHQVSQNISVMPRISFLKEKANHVLFLNVGYQESRNKNILNDMVHDMTSVNYSVEMDLKGYRVFYSNTSSEGEDYMILTKEPVKATYFHDTVTLNTLNEKIYYRVVAVDMNLNNSDFSETLVLEKPDTIKPVAPVFEYYQASDTSVYMGWVNGSSKDIVEQRLYRKAGIGDWIMLESFEKGISSFTDDEVLPGIGYQYSLVSVDDAGLTSGMSKPLSVKIMNKGITGTVDGLDVSYDEENQTVKLSWEKGDKEDCNFIIYRSYNGNGLKMLASASGANTSFEDKKVQEPGTYGYAVRAFYEDGTKSPMTSEKVIEIP
jgi:fibronectin type 3 domain-containing protein